MLNTSLTAGNDAEEKGRQLQEYMELLNQIHNIILDKENLSASREEFYYTLFTKIRFLLDSIYIQIYNLELKPHYTLVVVLALRTAMLDVLNLYYVMDLHDDEGAANRRINSIMNDHLKFLYDGFTQEQQERVRNDWPQHFDADNNLIIMDQLTAKKLHNGIERFLPLKIQAADALYIYGLFSKYEHNGVFTFDMLHNPFVKGGNDIVKFHIYKAIGICAYACKFVASHWIEEEDALMIKINIGLDALLVVEMPR